MYGKAADCHMLLTMIGEIKESRFDVFLSSFSASRRCSSNCSPSRLPVSPSVSYNIIMQQMTSAEIR